MQLPDIGSILTLRWWIVLPSFTWHSVRKFESLLLQLWMVDWLSAFEVRKIRMMVSPPDEATECSSSNEATECRERKTMKARFTSTVRQEREDGGLELAEGWESHVED